MNRVPAVPRLSPPLPPVVPTARSGPTTLARATARVWLPALAALAALNPAPAAAQGTVGDALAFLLTNRSIPTDDVVQDELAAAAAHDAISTSLRVGPVPLPVGSSASGFTYRLEPGLGGVAQRSSGTFGPLFTERSLTVGRGRGSVGFTFQHASFNTLDDRSLTDGTLVATANTLTGQAVPYDAETLTLRLRTNTVTLTGTYGVTDRLDIGAAIPFVWLALDGERVNIYRDRSAPVASASAAAWGLGDVALRVKYNLRRTPGGGVSVGAEARLPTGNEENLLGAGEASVEPQLIWSLERNRLAIDADFGYAVGGLSGQFSYGTAVTYIWMPRLMLIGEVSGAWLANVGGLVETTTAHPRLTGVETIRLSAAERSVSRVLAAGGVKWNPVSAWLVSASVMRRVTTNGLTASWVPTLAVEYAFGD